MARETLARMFWSRVEESGAMPAPQFKRGGGWVTLTSREVGDLVREPSRGLIAPGPGKGDAVRPPSGRRAEWVHADSATLGAGCVTVPAYPRYPPELIAYVVSDSGARTLIVEDPAQLAKALEARDS